MNNLKVSIITPSFNSSATISETIKSVLSQIYADIEYIIVDGSSKDGSDKIIHSYGNRISKFISEPDNGIYEAINKGIKLSTGDIVGILNSDDFFFNNSVVERIAESFQNNETESVFGDVQFVNSVYANKVVRYYSSQNFAPDKFKYGHMPAHPSFYVRREFYERFGYYRTDYKIAADYELLIRFLYIHKIRYKYLNFPFVCMRTGGVSNKSVFSNFTLNKEIARACAENGIKTNYFYIYSKYFTKIFQFFGKRITRKLW